jgi:hypothetical protein
VNKKECFAVMDQIKVLRKGNWMISNGDWMIFATEPDRMIGFWLAEKVLLK